MLKTYKVLEEFKVGRKVHEVGSEVELNKGEATDLLESGNIALVEGGEEKKSEVDSKLHPTPEALEDIKVAGEASKEAGEAAPDETNEERNFNTGRNVVGVNSPDPSVGEIVPVDLVMPGQKVDPDSGKVIEGGLGLSTPQPLPPEPEKPNKNEAKESKKGWIGNHTL